MISRYIKKIAVAGVLCLAGTSCLNDLDLVPKNEVTSASIYSDFNNYKNVLAKLYGGYSLTGQQGPDGRPDVAGIDEGASSYTRSYWQLQEQPTDETVLAWVNDAGVAPLNTMTWSASNDISKAMYYRIYYQITLANEFIRETSDELLSSRGIIGQELELAKEYRAEARVLRALSYWHALDLFGSVPFVTELDGVGSFSPELINEADLFTYIESELTDLVEGDELVDARQNEYARADKATAWTILAKLYLNAGVYIEQEKFTEAVTAAKNVIDAGYTLEPEYQDLFLADNHTSNEIIFPIAYDGVNSRSYGGTTFLVHASVGGSMSASAFGVSEGWFGLRTTKSLVNLFDDVSGDTDERAMFHTAGQELEIENLSTFTDGYGVTKYKNVTSAGDSGSDPALVFVDTDYPMFRLADVYLMYAEAVLRGGTGGDAGTALNYINELRERAFGDASGNISAGDLTLDFILDERARELYWEAHRRTDLIRYNLFTSGEYVWPWKGGTMEGSGVDASFSQYSIPPDDVIVNPNLQD